MGTQPTGGHGVDSGHRWVAGGGGGYCGGATGTGPDTPGGGGSGYVGSMVNAFTVRGGGAEGYSGASGGQSESHWVDGVGVGGECGNHGGNGLVIILY